MENQWFYTRGKSEQKGPVTQAELQAMVERGEIASSDLVWNDKMTDWVPAGRCPELGLARGAPALAPSPVPMPAGTGIPPGLAGWMQFVGVMLILNGVLLLCWMLIGVFLILAGSALLAAKSMLDPLADAGPSTHAFLAKLKTAFMMTGIFMIIYLVLGFLMMGLYFLLGVAAFASVPTQM